MVAANILVTSSSVKARADMPADILSSEAKYTRIFINICSRHEAAHRGNRAIGGEEFSQLKTNFKLHVVQTIA